MPPARLPVGDLLSAVRTCVFGGLASVEISGGIPPPSACHRLACSKTSGA
jgi:hypothetical protein